jgi:hypothetical protein
MPAVLAIKSFAIIDSEAAEYVVASEYLVARGFIPDGLRSSPNTYNRVF